MHASARFVRSLLPLCLSLSAPLVAQTRLFDPADLPGRARAAAALDQLLEADTDLATTVALAARAGTELAEGSGARERLVQALRRANLDADPAGARQRLRLDLGELVDTLTFRPVVEAELPEGFPGFAAVGEVELRRYPAYRMVRTEMRNGQNGAFWPLFRHIESNGIAMTTPVQTDWNEQSTRPGSMAFLYGDPAIEPASTADNVEVVDVEAATWLSIGATGYDRKAAVEALQGRLLDALAAPGCAWELAGPMRTMSYNSPMVRGDDRYYEVQVPVRPRAVLR